jgi:predicted ArsR family transcriptional regulator
MDKQFNIRFTVLQMAEKLEVTREAAYAYIQFLIARKQAVPCGTVARDPGKKGRGQIIYEANTKSVGMDTALCISLMQDYAVPSDAPDCSQVEVSTE